MSNSHILLVEDDPDHAELVTLVLGEQAPDVRVVHVARGREAIDHVRASVDLGERPRLVLLDVDLPESCGLDVLRALKDDHRTRAVPVVVLTTSAAVRDLHEAYAAGANGYVVKPVGFDALQEAARGLTAYWIQTNRVMP